MWQREQKAFGDEIARCVQDQVFSIARSVLRDLADAILEERITKVFISRLHELNGDDKKGVAEMLSASTEPARVRTAFELTREQQASIRQALNETFAADVSVRFELEPKGIGGIEMTSNGRKIAWNIDEYLNLLQKSIAEVTEVVGKTKPPAEELESESLV
jgi:F-type H+-transporting ATPase subunit b